MTLRTLFLDSVAMNHNSIGRGYETFGNGTAETLTKQPLPDETQPGMVPFDRRRRPNPSAGRRATTSITTKRRRSRRSTRSAQQSKTLLHNFYRKGFHSWRKGADEAPFAFVIPSDQGDPTRVAQLVSRLLAQRIEVHRATRRSALKEGTFPAGTYVVRLDQPYRNYAVDLLTPKFYPKDASEPYDDISWELPANYHLSVIAIADAAVRQAALSRVTEPPHPAGRVAGDGPVYVLKDTGQEGLLEASFRLARFKLEIAEQPFSAEGVEYPRGFLDLHARSRAWKPPSRTPPRASGSAFSGCRPRRRRPHTRRRVPGSACGSLGGYRHDRLGALLARSAPHSLRLRARRGYPPRQLARQVRRAALWARRSRARRADPGHSQGLGADAVQEDTRDTESRHAG